MLRNFQKTSLLLLFASFLLALIMATPAEADRRRSKIWGPGGTWTWGPDIPHCHDCDPSIELWGESGRAAYTAAAATMSKRSPTGEHLDSKLKEALRPHIGGLVDRVTLHWGTPGLDKWSANQIGINVSGTESAGQTYGHDIYLAQQKPSSYTQDTIKLIIHEMTHTKSDSKNPLLN